MKTIAFDIGSKRIGVATSDPAGIVASPLRVYERGDDPCEDARNLGDIAHGQGAERIVVGMPINLRGETGIAAEQVEGFVELLKEHTQVQVVLWDERMTTAIAERAMLEADVSRAGRRAKIDQVAAAVILQSFLDSQRTGARSDESEHQ